MDSKTIKHVASLARIGLSQSEEDKMKDQLGAIISFIEQLNKVNTDNIEPLYQTTGLVNSMRGDEYRGDFKTDEALNSKLIGQAPAKQDNFIKVKSVLNK